eukprot:scaffold11684_cov122-Isochrysis_galbana.AAC.1
MTNIHRMSQSFAPLVRERGLQRFEHVVRRNRACAQDALQRDVHEGAHLVPSTERLAILWLISLHRKEAVHQRSDALAQKCGSCANELLHKV